MCRPVAEIGRKPLNSSLELACAISKDYPWTVRLTASVQVMDWLEPEVTHVPNTHQCISRWLSVPWISCGTCRSSIRSTPAAYVAEARAFVTSNRRPPGTASILRGASLTKPGRAATHFGRHARIRRCSWRLPIESVGRPRRVRLVLLRHQSQSLPVCQASFTGGSKRSDWIRRRYGTDSLRRTKSSLNYRRTKNLRAVQLLLGHQQDS